MKSQWNTANHVQNSQTAYLFQGTEKKNLKVAESWEEWYVKQDDM